MNRSARCDPVARLPDGGVLEMLVFVVVDPGDLHWFGGAALELVDAQAVYTVTFLIFWVVDRDRRAR